MHSTSFTSSHDQSTDSAVGGGGLFNLNRSGAMSPSTSGIGDTKSIVLALQALQEKIRKLEHDRNFHQEQYEKSVKTHEAFKLEIEAQLDSERAEHRKREQELQDLLARANAERQRLQSTLEESKSDLSQFRVELEQLLDTERQQARTREDQLRDELEQLRSELLDEKKQNEALVVSVEQMKAEKDIIVNTNARLEGTVRELIVVNNNLMDSVKKGGVAVLNSGVSNGSRGRRTITPTGRPRGGSGAHNVSTSRVDPNDSASMVYGVHRTGSQTRRDISATRTRDVGMNVSSGSSSRFTYMYPTHSSAARDVRVGEIPARGTSAASPRRPSPLNRAPSQRTTSADAHQLRGLDDVLVELEEELRGLEKQYKGAVQEAASSDTPAEVLNATLNALMGHIQQKSEQIRLMRRTRQELASGGGGAGTNPDVTRRPPAKGVDKALQRGHIVTQLRNSFLAPTY